MILKDAIKAKVDRLDASDLRIVNLLINSLTTRIKIRKPQSARKKSSFIEVIDLMKPASLSTEDILNERMERI